MRNIVLFSLFILVVAIAVPQRFKKANGSVPAVSADVYRAQPQQTGPRSLTLYRRGNGHFETDAVVNGRHVQFLVDTGASDVVLRESEAARLGIRPTRRDYRARVSTANGVTLAARADLNQVEIGRLNVRHVAALILPDRALSHNLLGMSFLSRVGFEHKNGRLKLTQ